MNAACVSRETRTSAPSHAFREFCATEDIPTILLARTRDCFSNFGQQLGAYAPYACSRVTTYSALKKLGELIHEGPIIIFGAGGLGLMSLRLLKAMDGNGAVVVEVDPHKREAALAAGALAVVDGLASDAFEQIVQVAGGLPYALIDFVGSEQTAALAFRSVAKGGRSFGGAVWRRCAMVAAAPDDEGSHNSRQPSWESPRPRGADGFGASKTRAADSHHLGKP